MSATSSNASSSAPPAASPYADFLGLRVETDPDGAPVVVMPFDDALLGRPGFVHGGALAGLLEIAALAAVRHALGGDARTPKPINVTVDYMRGAKARETRARGIVTRLGRSIANVEAHAWQDDPATPVASARMNMLLG